MKLPRPVVVAPVPAGVRGPAAQTAGRQVRGGGRQAQATCSSMRSAMRCASSRSSSMDRFAAWPPPPAAGRASPLAGVRTAARREASRGVGRRRFVIRGRSGRRTGRAPVCRGVPAVAMIAVLRRRPLGRSHSAGVPAAGWPRQLKKGRWFRMREGGSGSAPGTAVVATVKWFNPVKGFGCLTSADGSPDIFCHVSAVARAGFDTLPEGATVTCEEAELRRAVASHRP